jgi:hypothetical protein
MSEIVGGLRRRLIKDNLYYMIHNSMDQLNWFSGDLSNDPVELISEQIDSSKEIKPNKISISAEDLNTREWEMGSTLDEYAWEIYIDIFAEDESVGIHLSGDIYDILTGKFTSLGRSDNRFNVYNLAVDGEPFLFSCELRNVEIGRVREWNKPFNKYWWVIGVTVVDYYYGDGG